MSASQRAVLLAILVIAQLTALALAALDNRH